MHNFANQYDEIEILLRIGILFSPVIVTVMQCNDSSKAETSSIINKTETKETGKTRREEKRKSR